MIASPLVLALASVVAQTTTITAGSSAMPELVMGSGSSQYVRKGGYGHESA